VFASKYRRQAIYGKIRADIGKMLRMLCQRKGIEIIEPGGVPGTGRVQLTEKAWRSVNKNSHLALDTIILKYLVEIQYKIGYYVPASKA
jgi:hypothetical protein